MAHIGHVDSKDCPVTERKTTMKTFMALIRDEAAKRALYRKTRNEIANLPRSVALDLGLLPEDADRIARQAVWG